MKKYEHFKGIAGIYIIRTTINSKVYIGSSINLYNRIKDHLKELRRNNHRNQLLQNHFNKYGMCFYFDLILECDKRLLIRQEQIYLDGYQSYKREKGFNINIKATSMLGFKHTKKTKEKMSKIRKGRKFSKEARKNMALAKQGSLHGASKLTEEKVLKIRRTHDGSRKASKILAEKYNVSWSTIHYIIIKKTWKHI